MPDRITAMGRPYFDLVLPTTKHERVLDLSTFSYKTHGQIVKAAPMPEVKRLGILHIPPKVLYTFKG